MSLVAMRATQILSFNKSMRVVFGETLAKRAPKEVKRQFTSPSFVFFVRDIDLFSKSLHQKNL